MYVGCIVQYPDYVPLTDTVRDALLFISDARCMNKRCTVVAECLALTYSNTNDESCKLMIELLPLSLSISLSPICIALCVWMILGVDDHKTYVETRQYFNSQRSATIS